MLQDTDHQESERFWTMLLDEPDDGRWVGWWGIVDETEGGIVATAGTKERAERLLRFLRDE